MPRSLLLLALAMTAAAALSGTAAACTEDGLICPDGSVLSRDPLRDCAFPACPSSATRVDESVQDNGDDDDEDASEDDQEDTSEDDEDASEDASDDVAAATEAAARLRVR